MGQLFGPLQGLFQILSGVGVGVLGQFLRCAAANQGSPFVASLRAQVDQIVGDFDDIQVVFNEHNGVPHPHQGLKHIDEPVLENAWYSVISPEGCASILWKDSGKMKEAAACLKLTADDLYSFGVIEQVISEHDGDFVPVYEELKEKLAKVLMKNSSLPIETLLDNRYNRFRRIGAPGEIPTP